jgi:hypothetical protein
MTRPSEPHPSHEISQVPKEGQNTVPINNSKHPSKKAIIKGGKISVFGAERKSVIVE